MLLDYVFNAVFTSSNIATELYSNQIVCYLYVLEMNTWSSDLQNVIHDSEFSFIMLSECILVYKCNAQIKANILCLVKVHLCAALLLIYHHIIELFRIRVDQVEFW